MAVILTSEVGHNGAGGDDLRSFQPKLTNCHLSSLSLCAQEVTDHLYQRLADAGLIKDRRHRLRNMGKCFVGSEVVDWLVEHAQTSRAGACDILSYLTFKEFIQRALPATDGHLEFEDGHSFYRFKSDLGCSADISAKHLSHRLLPDTRLLRDDVVRSRRCYSMSSESSRPQRSPKVPRKGSSTVQRSKRPVSLADSSTVSKGVHPRSNTSQFSSAALAKKFGEVTMARSIPNDYSLKCAVQQEEYELDMSPGRACMVVDENSGFFTDSDDIGASLISKTNSVCSVRSHLSVLSMVASVKEDSINQKDAAEFVECMRSQWKEVLLIKDHRYHLATYNNSFIASDAVTWLVDCEENMERQDAVELMQLIEQLDFIHHVTDSHHFQDSNHYFRFRDDDGTMLPAVSMEAMALGEDIYWHAKNSEPPVICNRSYRGKSYPMCIIAKEFVERLLEWKYFACRKEAVQFCRQLVSAGMLYHVCYEHQFKDAFLYFRFTFDMERERTSSTSTSGSRLRSSSRAVARLRRPVEMFTARRKSFRQRGDSYSSSSVSPCSRRSFASPSPVRCVPKSPSPSIHSQGHYPSLPVDNDCVRPSEGCPGRLSYDYTLAKRSAFVQKQLIGRSLSDAGLLHSDEWGHFSRPRTSSLCSESDEGGIFV